MVRVRERITQACVGTVPARSEGEGGDVRFTYMHCCNINSCFLYGETGLFQFPAVKLFDGFDLRKKKTVFFYDISFLTNLT
jgi:hypothetical protein